ncbi:4-(cytidine 5'-diphospho)-2-C-methyl-D-erythritol kinase [Geothrix sp. 21YS21S-4]|uniref:4-(cytidine 5'-diphospho)-2-C-methyl-D-erythritol kinase n=1 Tax=Geothrix sp. 21YS21S-4 TaxID=3068889 RepID=UPI0027B9F65A|nr:4-(cytidine 5'-diphospho)-2-C-methyl-D-erythritol kinase [Geothrix sp. 21YS21S-4]
MSATALAPAKLNRFLAVLGRRADGFHELELVTTVLDGVPELTDILEAEPAEALSLAISGPTGEGLEADESNLVVRAWRLLEAAARRPLPAALRLVKRIPHGAGLGGGSSDAAAALRLGNGLFGLGLDDAELLDLAARLGSDVPLFLLGGTVLGLGRGERVFPLRPVPLEPLLLAHPGLHVPTPNVYCALPEVGYPSPAPLGSLPEGAAPPWRNDLTDAAIRVCPPLAEVREALRGTGGEPLLCGSGSCWAAHYASSSARDAARIALRAARPDWSLWAV